MTHMRKQVRDQAASDLVGLASTGPNVFSGRVSSLKASEMPGLLVFAFVDDASEGAGNGGQTAQHSLVLKIEGVAQGNDDLLDKLDAMAAEVEVRLLAGSGDLSGLLMTQMGPPNTIIELHDTDPNASRRTGSVHMMFPCAYRTRMGDPETKV